jgi:hypothetical protein
VDRLSQHLHGDPFDTRLITPKPSPDEVLTILNTTGLNRIRTPHQVHLACTSGYSRPVVESRIATLRARGTGDLCDKGLEGAVVQIGMTVMAHNGAIRVRIRQQRLTKRGQQFRRLLGLSGTSPHFLRCFLQKDLPIWCCKFVQEQGDISDA